MFPASILQGTLGETGPVTYSWGTKRLRLRNDQGRDSLDEGLALNVSSGDTEVILAQSWSESVGQGTTPLRTATFNKIWLNNDEYEVSSIEKYSTGNGFVQVNLASATTSAYTYNATDVHVELTGQLQFIHNSIAPSESSLVTLISDMGSLSSDATEDSSYSFEQFIGETFTVSAYPNKTLTITDVESVPDGVYTKMRITFSPAFTASENTNGAGTVTMN